MEWIQDHYSLPSPSSQSIKLEHSIENTQTLKYCRKFSRHNSLVSELLPCDLLSFFDDKSNILNAVIYYIFYMKRFGFKRDLFLNKFWKIYSLKHLILFVLYIQVPNKCPSLINLLIFSTSGPYWDPYFFNSNLRKFSLFAEKY